MGGMMVEFTDQNFDTEVMKSNTPVLVDFWAEWCGPCHAITPAVEQISQDYVGKVKVGKVNVDKNQQTAMKFGIRSLPSLLIFKKGTVVNQIVGAVAKDSITKLIDETL